MRHARELDPLHLPGADRAKDGWSKIRLVADRGHLDVVIASHRAIRIAGHACHVRTYLSDDHLARERPVARKVEERIPLRCRDEHSATAHTSLNDDRTELERAEARAFAPRARCADSLLGFLEAQNAAD